MWDLIELGGRKVLEDSLCCKRGQLLIMWKLYNVGSFQFERFRSSLFSRAFTAELHQDERYRISCIVVRIFSRVIHWLIAK